MKSPQFFARYSEHAEGVVVAQIRFQREWKLSDVRERSEIARSHAGSVKFFSIVRHVRIGAL